MLLEKITEFFMPAGVKNNRNHPEYEEKFSIVTGIIWTFIFMTAMTVMLYLNAYHYPYFFYNGLVNLALLPFVRWNLLQPATLVSNVITYPMYFYFLSQTGGIHSVNVNIMYAYLLAAMMTLPNLSPLNAVFNLIVLYLLYLTTPESAVLGSRLYALTSHSLITLLIAAVYLTTLKKKHTRTNENKALQNNQIDDLNQKVVRRTQELTSMRQTLTADFHDETGNMLSVITRQAALLKYRPEINADSLKIVETIIANSNQLYASSRHFIWNLNNDSDDARVLFDYLTSFGQVFYNQFGISFSAENNATDTELRRLEPFAAINLIFIFKEAMNNVVKHAQAKEVVLSMAYTDESLHFSLTDDGSWKEPDCKTVHHGLSIIEKRCLSNNFRFSVNHIKVTGKRVDVSAPIIVKQTA